MSWTWLICPLTRKPINSACLMSDGYLYEVNAAVSWLNQNNVSPLTKRTLLHKNICPVNLLNGIDINTNTTIKSDYVCVLSNKIIFQVAIAADGNFYEKSLIEQWVQTSSMSPITKQQLAHNNICQCHFLQEQITNYLTKYSELQIHRFIDSSALCVLINDYLKSRNVDKLTTILKTNLLFIENNYCFINGEKKIHLAIEYLDYRQLFQLIRHDKLNVCDVDANNNTALHYLAITCHLEPEKIRLIKYCVEKGVNVNALNKYKKTAIEYTANEKCKNQFIRHGANNFSNYLNKKGHNAFHKAIINSDQNDLIPRFDLIVEQYSKTRCGVWPIHLACVYSPSMIPYFIDKGCDLTLRINGKTILHSACISYIQTPTVKNLQLVKYIIQKIDIDAADDDGNTALHIACKDNCRIIVHELIYAGANVSILNNNSQLAIELACINGAVSCVAMLLPFQIKYATIFLTGLLTTYKSNYDDIIELLFKSKIDYNHKTKFGQTLVHVMVAYIQYSGQKFANIILSNIPNINCVDESELTALQYACVHNQSWVQPLLKHGANPNTCANTTHCPIFLLCVKNKNEFDIINWFKILYYYGADFTVGIYNKWSIIDYMRVNKLYLVEKFLCEMIGLN